MIFRGSAHLYFVIIVENIMSDEKHFDENRVFVLIFLFDSSNEMQDYLEVIHCMTYYWNYLYKR